MYTSNSLNLEIPTNFSKNKVIVDVTLPEGTTHLLKYLISNKFYQQKIPHMTSVYDLAYGSHCAAKADNKTPPRMTSVYDRRMSFCV